MKTNISALMNLISEVEKNLSSKIYSIEDYALNISIEELDGKVNLVEDNKEIFNLNLEEIEKASKELSRLKAILYEKNNEFKLSDGRTIQQAIVDNTNLRKLKTTYENLLLLKNTKKRVTEVNNSYFESKTLNFDQNKLKKRLEEIDSEIQKTDFEISKLNSVEFSI
ncbi:MAG: hypothetical protein HXK72_02780 [Clostridiales bacterium]|jgi:hypothetical protein|nr:hypothetical protein [Clostridiales bacterium]